jgi:hypothetical protein
MSNNGKIIQFDRNKAAGPWQPLVQIQLTEDAIKSGVAAGYQNNKARVFVKRTASSGFMVQGPNGQAQPMPIIHLIIAGLGGRKLDYHEIQRVKNELVHEESDAVELYPGKAREMDMPQTHLWCLPPGYTMPLGLVKARPADPNAELIPGSRIKREDLLFYVVMTQGEGSAPVVEVFASEDDAQACYELASGTFVPGEYVMYGMVPHEEEGAAWSPGAIERRNSIQARIEAAGAAMAASQAAGGGHPPTEAEMREGIAAKAAERESALSKAESEADASGDEDAKASLAAMREELVRTGGIKASTNGDTDKG